MPTFGNTNGLLEAVASLMRGARKADGELAYANVIKRGLKDYTDELPVGVVFAAKGSSQRYTLGRSAKIKNRTQFNIGSVVSYHNSEEAEALINDIRDAVTYVFQESATARTLGVTSCNIVEDSEQWDFLTINGQPCRSHEFLVEIVYEYTLPLGPQP